MVKLYLNKINNGVINTATEKAWCAEDVPIMWRSQVQEALDADPY